ncbi:von Willebrand factor D and EGF domain-containing protein-like [Ostrea edulis]|uniref:von Willebrand factor D and EGF domain-containing protein-like n=1 Tax=Ostrea edulis TaxID=37623 RepID=UPI0024AF1E66|nr:von Willebrand factor D and EGF domain-containing protein-like [Ostrea edulis]
MNYATTLILIFDDKYRTHKMKVFILYTLVIGNTMGFLIEGNNPGGEHGPETYAGKRTKCNLNAKEIPYLPLRKANFLLGRTEQPICDRALIPNGGSWYKIEENIVTNETLPYRCGTENGIWMNGTIPERGDGIVNRTTCVPGLFTTCDFTYNIMVENCGVYRMYFLPPPSRCNEAYCFGYGKSGRVPTNTTEKPTIRYGFEKIIERYAFESFYFECSFQTLQDDAYFYQIHWFANGQNIRVMQPVKRGHIAQSRWTLDTDLPTFNVNVSCAVSLMYGQDQKAGPMSSRSDEFFAGIKVSPQSIIIPRGHTGQVDLSLTVPIPCSFRNIQDSKPENCHLDLEVYLPSFDTCTPKINSQGRCAVSIRKDDWNKSNGLVVRHDDDALYKLYHYYEIHLRTVPLIGAKMWRGIILPPIKVTITEASTVWQGRSCYAHTTSHMKTFDGIKYDNQNDGTFIMYRSQDGSGNIMEVQTKTTECNNLHTGIFCNCAIAVRAAGDVFVINRCPHTQAYFNFKSCHNDILMIKKIDDLNYKFVFPTGTYLNVRLRLYEAVNVMEIEIFPSLYDIYESEGLCSRLGSSGVLYARDHSHTPYQNRPDVFSRSWRVLPKEDLIGPNSLSLQGLRTVHLYCTCEVDQPRFQYSNISVCNYRIHEQCNIITESNVHTTCRMIANGPANRRDLLFIPQQTSI